MSKPSTTTDSHDRGRFSARRKTEAVLRLLRGEDLETLSRQLGVTSRYPLGMAGRLLGRRHGRHRRAENPADERDEEIAPAPGQGRPTDDGQRALLGQKCQHMESGRPFATRRRSG